MRVASVVQVAGKLKARRASGTLRASVTIADAQGNAVDGCESGTLRWKATRAPGRVFGGSTSQDRPVVVRLDRAGRLVEDLVFGWQSNSCTPDSLMAIADSLTDFPIRAHRFGDSFSQSFAMNDGSKRTYDYDLAGRLTSRAARGTFRVQLSQVDPAGAPTLSCDTGTVSWSARTG